MEWQPGKSNGGETLLMFWRGPWCESGSYVSLSYLTYLDWSYCTIIKTAKVLMLDESFSVNANSYWNWPSSIPPVPTWLWKSTLHTDWIMCCLSRNLWGGVSCETAAGGFSVHSDINVEKRPTWSFGITKTNTKTTHHSKIWIIYKLRQNQSDFALRLEAPSEREPGFFSLLLMK